MGLHALCEGLHHAGAGAPGDVKARNRVAVAVGIRMAADLSARHQWLTNSDALRIEKLLQSAGLPTSPPDGMNEEQFMKHMAIDKKVLDDGLRLVLLKAIGTAVITGEFSAALLSKTLSHAA